MLPGTGVVAARRAADARAGDRGGRKSPATVAGTFVRLGRGVACGKEEAGTGDGDATEGTGAREAGALATASPGPPSTTASVIAAPAAASTPPTAAAPDRKLTSSIRAYIARFSRPNPGHSPLTRHSTVHGYQTERAQARAERNSR